MGKSSDSSRKAPHPFLGRVFRPLALVALLSVVIGCGKTADQRFIQVKESFLDQWFHWQAEKATWVGVDQYDQLLPDIAPQAMQGARQLYHTTLDQMADIDPAELSYQHQVDLRVFRGALHYLLFQQDTLRVYALDPNIYLKRLIEAVTALAMQRPDSSVNRLAHLEARLRGIPSWLNQAYQNLEPGPVVAIEAAARHARQLATFLGDGRLYAYLDSVNTSTRQNLDKAMQTAAGGLNNFADRLETELLPRSDRSFRLGEDLFRQKLRYLVPPEWTAAAIQSRAQASLSELQDQMYAIADTLAYRWWSVRYARPDRATRLRVIRRVFDRIQSDAPDAGERRNYMVSQLGPLREFVNQHKVVAAQATWPVQVQINPLGSPAAAFASLQTTGPLVSSYRTNLNLTPLPGSWTTPQVREYLQEYNRQAEQLVLIHQQYPGIATLYYYAKRYPSLIRSLFPDQAFVRGWGYYSERMLVDDGWGQDDPRVRLNQLRREAQVAVGALLDQRVHTQNLSRADAITMMTQQAFYTMPAASEEWQSIQLDPGRGTTAFVGKEEIWDLRVKYTRKAGSNFSLLDFHNRLLSYGAIPIPYLREILLENRL